MDVFYKENPEHFTEPESAQAKHVLVAEEEKAMEITSSDIEQTIADIEAKKAELEDEKEKIKQLKTNVDVLTMTATPIPRTLHMSILGIRDMSVIYEPPQNRRPVQTYVLEYDEETVKEAIKMLKLVDKWNDIPLN